MRIEPSKIIQYLRKNFGRVRQTARELGISAGTVINWRKRARTGVRSFSSKGLQRHPTCPATVRGTSLTAGEQDAVVAARKKTGFCAIKICDTLKLPYHPLTIHRFLKTKGLVQSNGRYRRPLFQNTKHMHVKNVTTIGKLQMDVKYVTPELSGLEHTCYLYAVIDIFSRFKQGVVFPLLDQGYAISALRMLLPLLPFNPDFIQTDNGLEFQKQFHQFVTEHKGWKHHYIHKSNPNENAVIERSFRTDQDEFFFFRLRRMGRPKSIFQLNLAYQAYMQEYNETRPHLSLNLLTPLQKVRGVQ